jgi:prevent-host-death family protein
VEGSDRIDNVLRSPHMKTVPVRELQQHSSAVVRRVREGESVGITDRGTLVAVLVPPSAVGGTGALLAAGRVRPATVALSDLPPRVRVARPTSEVLDEFRAER